MKEINVMYASDDNFVEVMATSIVSLLENNKSYYIDIYIVSDNISYKNKELINSMVLTYENCKIVFVEMPDLDEIIGETVDIKRYAKSMFSRILVGSLCPAELEKILYIDCDTMILGDVSEIYFDNLQGKVFGAVNDCRNIRYNNNLGMKKASVYINTGVLIINLSEYREKNYEKLLIDKIYKHNGQLEFPDNDIICRYMEDEICYIPPKYNAISVLFSCNREQLIRLRKPQLMYSKAEYDEAVNNPTIVHFTTCFLLPARPWFENYEHKFAKRYLDYRNLTPWRDEPLRKFKPTLKTKLVKFLPKGLVVILAGYIHSFLKPILQKKINTQE